MLADIGAGETGKGFGAAGVLSGTIGAAGVRLACRLGAWIACPSGD
jgi:hypothetical protein